MTVQDVANPPLGLFKIHHGIFLLMHNHILQTPLIKTKQQPAKDFQKFRIMHSLRTSYHPQNSLPQLKTHTQVHHLLTLKHSSMYRILNSTKGNLGKFLPSWITYILYHQKGIMVLLYLALCPTQPTYGKHPDSKNIRIAASNDMYRHTSCHCIPNSSQPRDVTKRSTPLQNFLGTCLHGMLGSYDVGTLDHKQ